jgi:hypothetical protein
VARPACILGICRAEPIIGARLGELCAIVVLVE